MHDSDPRPVLTVYRRAECELCDDARELLQHVMEDRVRHGEPIAVVREVDIGSDAELERRYGTRIPVFEVAGAEIELVTTLGQVRGFLDRTLGRLA